MKCIILCADDYGQNSAISQAIISLIECKRLSAVSCMTNTPFWPEAAAQLKNYKNQIDIGLHLNLTFGSQQSTLQMLIIRSQLRLLNQAKIERAIHHQIDQFVDQLGYLPDFIDGHQHVHQFPMIRDTLLKIYQARLKHSNCYFRSTFSNHQPVPKYFINKANFKHTIIQFLGASAFKKQLIAHKIPHNASFSGIYEFHQSEKYEQWFDLFLHNITHKGLIMCHPGLAGDSADPIVKARIDEYRFLSSDQYLSLCHKNNVKIVRYNQFKV